MPTEEPMSELDLKKILPPETLPEQDLLDLKPPKPLIALKDEIPAETPGLDTQELAAREEKNQRLEAELAITKDELVNALAEIAKLQVQVESASHLDDDLFASADYIGRQLAMGSSVDFIQEFSKKLGLKVKIRPPVVKILEKIREGLKIAPEDERLIQVKKWLETFKSPEVSDEGGSELFTELMEKDGVKLTELEILMVDAVERRAKNLAEKDSVDEVDRRLSGTMRELRKALETGKVDENAGRFVSDKDEFRKFMTDLIGATDFGKTLGREEMQAVQVKRDQRVTENLEQIRNMAIEGKNAKEIAEALKIEFNSIETYLLDNLQLSAELNRNTNKRLGELEGSSKSK